MAVQNTLMHSYFMSDQCLSCNCRYEAKPPKDIKFVPLNQVKEYTAEQLMELYSVSEFLIIFFYFWVVQGHKKYQYQYRLKISGPVCLCCPVSPFAIPYGAYVPSPPNTSIQSNKPCLSTLSF